jgi:small conductance mechanosensitive channel
MGALRRLLAGIIYVAAALLLVEVWFGGTIAWLTSDVGRAVAGRIVTIALVLAVALALWELVTTLVERVLSRADSDGPGSRGARVRTLLPLIRNVARVVLGVIVTLTVLSELGVDIAPLLAGAGIAGLAIGFGAQSLVKDVITGVFILLEDSIAVGDVVNVGGHGGIVEAMTVRTVRLRDLSGNVHVVPFGEVASVLNMTKEFSYALIEAGVAYKEDVDRVIEVLKEIGAGMEADPEFGPMILEPLEVLGLDSFGESSVNIRVRIKTRPIKQWSVLREFHRRMKRAFDERGIEIPFPHRTVFFGAEAGEAEKFERPVAGGAAPPAEEK